MYFQKPGRNSENLEKVSKKPMATLSSKLFLTNYNYGLIVFIGTKYNIF